MASQTLPKMSLVSQYDDLCRYTKVLTTGCEEEFKAFVLNQKQFLRKWRESESEVQNLRQNVNQLEGERVRFEAQLKHLRGLIEEEVERRKIIEREKSSMERQLALIKEVLLADGSAIDNRTKERLFLLSNPYEKRKEESPIKLTTIEESVDLLSASDFDQTDDDIVEGSRKRRSKGKRRSSGERYIQKRKKSDGMEALHEELQLPDLDFDDIGQDVNLNYRRSSSEPASNQPHIPSLRPQLRSDSEQYRKTYDRNSSVFSSRTPVGRYSTGGKLSRCHAFCMKTMLKGERCNPCNKPVGFCKQGLKCQDCRIVSHIECKEKCPLPCIPVAITPTKANTGTISDYTSNTPPMIPLLIVRCVNEIESRGLQEVGLYRVPGSDRDVKELKEKFLKNKSIPSLGQIDIHAVCGTVKEFLRSLKDPLITRAAWKSFVEAAENKNEDISFNLLYNAVCDLPQPNKETLAFLILHLQRVSDSLECRMPIENLAKVFGPTIVGYSSPDPVDADLFSETNHQHRVVQKLLMIPSDSWQNILNVEPDVFNTNMKTPECLPAPITSRLGPIYSASTKHQGVQLEKTRLTPRRKRDTSKSMKRQFFTSPMLK